MTGESPKRSQIRISSSCFSEEGVALRSFAPSRRVVPMSFSNISVDFGTFISIAGSWGLFAGETELAGIEYCSVWRTQTETSSRSGSGGGSIAPKSLLTRDSCPQTLAACSLPVAADLSQRRFRGREDCAGHLFAFRVEIVCEFTISFFRAFHVVAP